VLDEVTDRRKSPAALSLGKTLRIYCTAGCVSPRAGLGGYQKSHFHRELDPRIFQPLESRYTDYAVGGQYKKKINPSKSSGYYSYMYQQVQHLEFCILPTKVVYVYCLDRRTHSGYFRV
jgi:hypothetical protein